MLNVRTGRGAVTRSESKKYKALSVKALSRLKVSAERMIRHAGSVAGQARVKTRRTSKNRDWEK